MLRYGAFAALLLRRHSTPESRFVGGGFSLLVPQFSYALLASRRYRVDALPAMRQSFTQRYIQYHLADDSDDNNDYINNDDYINDDIDSALHDHTQFNHFAFIAQSFIFVFQ